MSLPIPPVLRQLHRLDRSSTGFHNQLSNVLYGEQYHQCVPNLQADDLVWLVDYLDKALDDLDPSGPAFRKCLRELRSVCGDWGILPTAYTLSSQLLNIDQDPFASGGFGDVYYGTLDGSRVCIKRMRVYMKDGPQKAVKAFCQEAAMWKRLTHPNILPLLGVTIAPPQLVSNWMPGGDLQEYIKKNPDANRLGLLSDVANGLCYLHSCNVIHGDLKGLNILVDDSSCARIADFGLAKVTQNLDSMRSTSPQNGHSARWTAPEVLKEGTCSKEADIFSFAMVMIEVFTGAVPFNNGSSAMAMLAITQGKRPPRPTHPTFTEELWALMQRCWNHHPHVRPEASEALRVLLTPGLPAWNRLISNALAANERIPLITTIFSDSNQVEMVEHLSGDDAQNFINIIDEALDSLEPAVRKRALNYLRRFCGRQTLLPRSLRIPLCYDPTDSPLYHGELVDVWKGRYQGQEVAAEVLKLWSWNDPGNVRRRFCEEVMTWKCLRHLNVLPLLGVTMIENRLVMVSEWMENGNIIDYVKANTNVDRLGLLRDVAKGLIYMHEQGIIHGDLKGGNIMIDGDGRARLTGSSLLKIASESTPALSARLGSAIRWMSPELFSPEHFGLKESFPTKESDCYALGMVIYEVLSGQVPFAPLREVVVISKILDNKRPVRPGGEEGRLFTDGIWEILELCWRAQPRERITAKAVLLGLEGKPFPLRSTSPKAEGDAETVIDGLPVLPQAGNQMDGGIGNKLTRSVRKMFKAVIRKLDGLLQAR